MYVLHDTLVTPNSNTYILIRNHRGKTLIRPDTYTNYYTTRGWTLEGIGDRELCLSIEDIICKL